MVLNSQYDPNGNRTALSAAITPIGGTTSTNDFLNSYTYDRLNRQTQIVQQSNGGYAVGYKKSTLGYDAASRLTSLADFKDSTTQAVSGSYGYDAVNRLTSLTWYGPGGPFNSSGGYSGGSYGGYFESMSWGYDIDNRVASMTNLDYANENLSYTYDHDSQLINAAASYGGYGGYGGLGGGTYSWDDNGNSTKTGWITGAGNRLLFDGTYSYVYDDSGHIVQRSTSTAETDYSWDNRGRMISVKSYTKSGTTLTQIQQVDYGYDAFNDLISRTLTPYTSGNPSTTGVITTRFVYDLPGGNAVLAFNGNGSMTDRYLWGPAVDQILADERFAPSGSNQMPSAAGTAYWALTDNENSVRDWITYGSLVDHIIYDSFGKVFSHSNSSITFAFGHNGVFYDPATGLEWHSQPSTDVAGRWYNPAVQRWMSEDPIGLGPDSNPYRYVGNSPTNEIDPSGLIPPIRINPGRPPRHAQQNHDQYCARLKEKIENVSEDIWKRIREFVFDRSRGEMPVECAGPNKLSRNGHLRIIADKIEELKEKLEDYWKNCPNCEEPVLLYDPYPYGAPVPIRAPAPAPYDIKCPTADDLGRAVVTTAITDAIIDAILADGWVVVFAL